MKTESKRKSFSQIIKGETPVLVDFYADWCAPCKLMPPVLSELKEKMGDSINIIKVDTDKNPAVAIKYQVRGVPTLILFKKGKILWQSPGVKQARQLETIINQKLESY
ncbi:MAG: thioredoxin [Balneolales bacterium]